MIHLDHPFGVDPRGRTRAAGDDDHIRDLIEQVLFCAPGERVNRPDFGSPLRQAVFGAASPELATATRFLVQGALEQWLGDLIQVEDVEVSSEDARLEVTVRYVVRRDQTPRVATFGGG